ncbi:MAG TPA: hypothetical protein VKG78_09800, partial [Opitutaceae bacterium]|nr:hypothetical protein [Opitutaceae bacterium]
MTDDEKPPARRFVLKPMEVVPTDTPARPGDGTAISIPLMHRQNEIAELRSSLGRRDDSAPDPGGAQRGSPFLAPREITPTDPRACPGDGTAISVELILKGNRIAAGTREPEAIALPRRKVSRRTRDFALLMALAGLAVTAL